MQKYKIREKSKYKYALKSKKKAHGKNSSQNETFLISVSGGLLPI